MERNGQSSSGDFTHKHSKFVFTKRQLNRKPKLTIKNLTTHLTKWRTLQLNTTNIFPIERIKSKGGVSRRGTLSSHKSFCGICATTTPASRSSFSAAFIPSASGLIVRSLRFRVAFIWTSVFGMAATGWRSTIRLNIEPQGHGGFQKTRKKQKKKTRKKEKKRTFSVKFNAFDGIQSEVSILLCQKITIFLKKIAAFLLEWSGPFIFWWKHFWVFDKIRGCANVEPFFWLFYSFSPFFPFLRILQRHKFTDTF